MPTVLSKCGEVTHQDRVVGMIPTSCATNGAAMSTEAAIRAVARMKFARTFRTGDFLAVAPIHAPGHQQLGWGDERVDLDRLRRLLLIAAVHRNVGRCPSVTGLREYPDMTAASASEVVHT